MINFFKYLFSKNWRKYKLHKELKRRFPTCSFAENIVIKGPLDNLKLGKNVKFQSNVFLHLGGMEWCKYEGNLEIGDDSVISPNTIIYAAGSGGVKIGKRFDCGPGVKIFSSRSDYENKGNYFFNPVIVGDDVTVFANVVVSPGVTIGNGSCIAAGSIVINNIEENYLAGGIPATIIKAI